MIKKRKRQEIIGMKEVYIDNDLVYKNEDDGLFTGIAQSKRKNGHLVYEEEYEKGIILSSNLYYNGKEKRVSNKVIFLHDGLIEEEGHPDTVFVNPSSERCRNFLFNRRS